VASALAGAFGPGLVNYVALKTFVPVEPFLLHETLEEDLFSPLGRRLDLQQPI
jgi:hypothetical protein